MKQRIYISGSISQDPNYKEHFAQAQKQLQEQGFAVVNPASMDKVLIDAEYEEFMFADLHLLVLCDAIYMLRGWEQSLGANREIGFALGCGMKILYEPEEV